MSDTHPLIAAALAAPKTHRVATHYKSGNVRTHETRSRASAETFAVGERRKIGRNLISHDDGSTVVVTEVRVECICTALLAMPVSNRAEAEAFITALHGLDLDYHFDDGAVDCLHGNGLVSLADAEAIEAKIADCYTAWEASGADLYHDCPIGHLLSLMEAAEAIGAVA